MYPSNKRSTSYDLQDLGFGLSLMHLKNGQVIVVDTITVAAIERYSWWGDKKYVQTKIKGRTLYLHRLLTSAPPSMWVDHINGNTWDCRMVNLRVCSPSDNCRNQQLRSSSTSGYKGVSWASHARRWRASIRANGKNLNLGYFATKEDAASAYDHAAVQYFGSFARTNKELSL